MILLLVDSLSSEEEATPKSQFSDEQWPYVLHGMFYFVDVTLIIAEIIVFKTRMAILVVIMSNYSCILIFTKLHFRHSQSAAVQDTMLVSLVVLVSF